MKKILISLLILISIFIVGCNITYATDEDLLSVTIDNIQVFNEKGENITYIPGCANEIDFYIEQMPTLLNLDLDYTDATYEMYLDGDYGKNIKTELGTFTFKKVNGEKYVYTCPVDYEILSKGMFMGTLITTTSTKELRAEIFTFTTPYNEDGFLKLGDTYFVKDGKIVQDVLRDDNGKIIAYYDASLNELGLIGYKGTVSYGGMGTYFNIYSDENTEYTVELPFVDVLKDAWSYSAIEFVYRYGLILGTSSTTFEPGTKLTRGMIVTILHRIEGEIIVEDEENFPDVSKSDYFYESVKWAAKNGVISGYADGYFRPNQPVTREEFAVMLHNFTKKFLYSEEEISANLKTFSDSNSISDYALPAMNWAIANGVITGNADKTLKPQGTATRDVAASMIYKYFINMIIGEE